MANEYLQIPIRTDLITRQQELKRCSLNDSVANMFRLISITHFGECKQDDSFGNELWEFDFETVYNMQAFKERLSQSLQNTVTRHEKRLSNIKVNVAIEQVLTTIYKKRIRQRIQISLEGTIRKTNEPFKHQELFFMGPLSYY
ncbi:GPW/gp25 family protein [Sediminicola luteus]|uniref:GPW/gp25 family protein n=1 Tax=Sediminicola luteus TaxID=319238 RepID=A0ABV2TZP0_9FLAO